MSKLISLKLFKTVAVALFVLAFLLPGSIAWGQNPTLNPVIGKIDVWFVRNGVECSVKVDVPGTWDPNPNIPNWNGKFTVNGPTGIITASGQMEKPRIGNVNTSLTFPITQNGWNITAAEVNASWDDYYCVGLPGGAQRIGEPTWEYNCHGHSTDLGYWVNGIGNVIYYDWRPALPGEDIKGGLFHQGSWNHSIKITDTWTMQFENSPAIQMITETTEKMAYAGKYKYTFAPFISVYPVYVPI